MHAVPVQPTGALLEIHGTDGAIVIRGAGGIQGGGLDIRGARRGEVSLEPIVIDDAHKFPAGTPEGPGANLHGALPRHGGRDPGAQDRAPQLRHCCRPAPHPRCDRALLGGPASARCCSTSRPSQRCVAAVTHRCRGFRHPSRARKLLLSRLTGTLSSRPRNPQPGGPSNLTAHMRSDHAVRDRGEPFSCSGTACNPSTSSRSST